MTLSLKELIAKVLTRNDYSTTETVVGRYIDGKPIYRKCKEYTWTGSRIYDDTFFSGISVDKVISIRPQITNDSSYLQTSFYWNTTDYFRCWVYWNAGTKGRVAIDGSQNTGSKILFVAEYTKTTD